MHIGFWCESQKERDHYKDVGVGGRILLSRVLVTIDGVRIGDWIYCYRS
jgi:hypothetical protein